MTSDPPDLPSVADLNAAFDALLAREPIFHRPEFGSELADWERTMHPGFWEVGASGQVYSRAFMLAELERRRSDRVKDAPWKVHDPACRALARDVYLFTYRLQQSDRHTRRSTIWVRVGDDWQIAYHQGTVIADQGDADGAQT